MADKNQGLTNSEMQQPEKSDMKKLAIVIGIFAIAMILLFAFYWHEKMQGCKSWIERGSNMTFSGEIWKYAGNSQYSGWQLIKSDTYDMMKVARCKG